MRTIKKIKKTVEIEEMEETIHCDLCRVKAISERDWDDSSAYNFNKTDIKVKIIQKEGTKYPEGGNGEEYIVDLCPKCFKEKLIPWLNSQGANIKQTDWYS